MKLAAIIILVVVGVAWADVVLPCGPHEEYTECGTACPETCDNLGETRPCILLCVRGCFCQQGYVRNNATGACVLPCDCPPKTTTVTPAPPTDTTCN
ncbi:hypothetical protein RP20_CCG023607 [Aedes albopictus]|nr:chymotrypsin inhibitor-like [Aedes albopictus]KXJ80744.1 hypothetical protein RP20_CCG023607 [Aedes albopictus]